MPNYPASIDNSISLPISVDSLTPASGAVVNKLRDAIIAVETELGVKPSGLYGTVKARLDALESVITSISYGVQIAGDIGGISSNPIVIGLQTRPVSSAAPTVGQVLRWNGVAWTPFTLIPVGTTIGQVPVWDGSVFVTRFAYVDNMIPPLVVELTGTELYEVGQSVATPAFTALYSEVPVAATLVDSVNLITQNVIGSYAAFNSAYTFVYNTYGASVVFTLTGSQGISGSIVKTSEFESIWTQKIFHGKGAAAQTGEAFIEALSDSALVTSAKGISFNITTGVGEKIYFACRSAYGTIFFKIQNVPGGFTMTGAVSVTNAHGFTENYDLYESNSTNLGNVTIYTE